MALAVACGGGGGNPSGPSTTPIVRGVAPGTGSTFGGTEVTISGERFVGGATVLFGETPAIDVAVESATTIRAKTPPHASGSVDVTVSGSGGSSALAQGFTYSAPSTTNTPPDIKSLTAKGRRTNEPDGFADLSETIDVKAVVEDAETPIDQLKFEWSASTGTIDGTGPAVTWTAPAAAATPVDVTLTLTVIETYKAPDASGLPVDKENKATGKVTVTLHNSLKEIANMAEDFMVAFSDSNIKDPAVVLRDFTTSCSGTDNERGDIIKNRETREIKRYTFHSADVTINFGGSCTLWPPSQRFRPGDACALLPWEWWSEVIAPLTDPYLGMTDHTAGTDQVVAIYKSPRWWLCDSDWKMTLQEFKK